MDDLKSMDMDVRRYRNSAWRFRRVGNMARQALTRAMALRWLGRCSKRLMGDGDNVSSTQKPLRRFLEQSGARTYGLPVMRALQASDFELRYIPSMKRGGKPYIGDENSRI